MECRATAQQSEEHIEQEERPASAIRGVSQSCVNQINRLVEEYNDAFPDDLPKGLPPKRGVTMTST